MAQAELQESTDKVICETRRIKEELAAALDFDIDCILAEARRKQQQSGREIIPAPRSSPKPPSRG